MEFLWDWDPTAWSFHPIVPAQYFASVGHTYSPSSSLGSNSCSSNDPRGRFYISPFMENRVVGNHVMRCSVGRYIIIMLFLFFFIVLTNVKLLKKLMMRKLKEGNEMDSSGMYSLSSLREFRDKGWKTSSRNKGWEFLLSSEMSISELKDHSEMTTFIIQISWCFIFCRK